MGVPVAVKDLIRVDGMPALAGTRIDVDDLIGPEGPVVASLRRAGCIILGKTKTVEFALGITGVSAPRGTPVNPWDPAERRLPGGSSSGSAVATAAGLCAFAIGSDTGGSVRVPAALNGIFGLKTSFGTWSNEGAFALAPHLDTIGLLTRSAEDAAIAFACISGYRRPDAAAVARLRLGRPSAYFFDGLTEDIDERVSAALRMLQEAGARLEDVEMPEAPEREAYFPLALPVSLVANLGTERVQAGMNRFDPVIGKRIVSGLDVKGIDYLALEQRRQASMARARRRFAGFDAWITPTTAAVAAPVAELDDPEAALTQALGMTRNTQPANYLDLTAASLPLPMQGHGLPAGLQLLTVAGRELELLSVCLAVEGLLGRPSLPDISGFDGAASLA